MTDEAVKHVVHVLVEDIPEYEAKGWVLGVELGEVFEAHPFLWGVPMRWAGDGEPAE